MQHLNRFESLESVEAQTRTCTADSHSMAWSRKSNWRTVKPAEVFIEFFFILLYTKYFHYLSFIVNLHELAKIHEKSSLQLSDSVWSLFLCVCSIHVLCAQLASFASVDVIFQSKQTMRQANIIQFFVVSGQSCRKEHANTIKYYWIIGFLCARKCNKINTTQRQISSLHPSPWKI